MTSVSDETDHLFFRVHRRRLSLTCISSPVTGDDEMTNRRRYYKELRMAQLRAIVELARGGGFAGTAQTLELSTPSVWQQVRGLEAQFGVALVNVTGQHVTLTEDGRRLVDLAEPVVQGFDSIHERFTQHSAALPQRLTVAAPGNVLISELPDPIRHYREQYPQVELSLIDSPSNPCRRMLEEGEVDLAVAGQLDLSFPASLVADHVTRFPFTLVFPEGHPIASVRRIQPRSIARFPLVMSSTGTNSRQRVDEVFAKAGLQNRLRIAFETSTKELLLEYVQKDFGIAVVPVSPRYLTDSGPDSVRLQGLALRDVSRQFGEEHIVILRRRHRHEPPHQKAFRETVLNSLPK